MMLKTSKFKSKHTSKLSNCNVLKKDWRCAGHITNVVLFMVKMILKTLPSNIFTQLILITS